MAVWHLRCLLAVRQGKSSTVMLSAFLLLQHDRLAAAMSKCGESVF